MMQSVAEHQEAPEEDAARMSVAEPRKMRRDRRNLATVRHQKKQNQDLDAICRRKE
jgi:hypothetical protein